MNTTTIPKLKSGDKVALISSARKINKEELLFATELIHSWGLNYCFGENLFAVENQFAGTTAQRIHDFKTALDDDTIKAILFVRGGYGSIQVVDHINWIKFKESPKWIVGFSDITVFHSHIHENLNTPTLHAAMPITFANNSKSSLNNLKKLLFGEQVSYKIKPHPLNRKGKAKAEIIGGNLSILYSLLGSISQMNTDGKILFIEDLDEYLYHIDRMMQALDRAGMFKNLAGLIVGGMSDMNDNEIPYGKTAEEIIQDVVLKYNYPVVYGFPAGHITNNQPLIFGQKKCLIVNEQKVIVE